MAKKSKRKQGKLKAVAYTLLTDRDHPEMYRLLARLVSEHHDELRDAHIVLAWCTSWREDVDGRRTIGRCKRASDLDRECAPYDLVILISKDFYTNPSVTDEQREALLDEQLEYATVKLNPETLEPMEDERGRKVYRLRRPDTVGFSSVAARRGCWTRDLEVFAAALARGPAQPSLLGD